MLSRLHIRLHIFISKVKNDQIVSAYDCPHKIKTNRLLPFPQWCEHSSVKSVESYRLRAGEGSVRGGVFLGSSS